MWIAVMYSCNKQLPTVFDAFTDIDTLNQFISDSKIKNIECNHCSNDDCSNNDDFMGFSLDLDVDVKSYQMTDTEYFSNLNLTNYFVVECHLENMTTLCCKPRIAIIDIGKYKICEIMDEFYVW